MKILFLFLFGFLIISVPIWFFLCYKIFEILRIRHPEKYKLMGEPSPIMNNTSKQQRALIKFLFYREWREIKDRQLTIYSRSLLLFYATYLSVILFALVYSVF